jgi:16S rRNA (uracil1498-N3)-methyltransferase
MTAGLPPGPEPALVAAAAMVFVDDLGAPVLADEDAHHLVHVMRLRGDETVIASDGAGGWVPCRLSGLAGGGSSPGGGSKRRGAPVSLVVAGSPCAQPGPDPVITVAFVPTKGERPEWATQKLTELGVDRIVPLRSNRSVVRWEGPRGDRAVDRLRRVAREASAQCRRAWLPEVTPVMDLDGLATLTGTRPCLARMGGGRPGLTPPVIAVGPEGGWDEDEVSRWGDGVGLGPTVLRAETAAVVAGTLLCALRAGVVGPLA